jgi:hypothetical protein
MATPNALFAIISVSNPASLEARLQAVSHWPSIKVSDGQWLLVAPSGITSKEVSDSLGITGEAPIVSNGIVLRVESYFGRHPQSTWEWIRTKKEAELGTPA